MNKLKKYILDKGFITRGCHVSYEVCEVYDTFGEAKKEADLTTLLPNEYVWVIDNEEDEYVVVYDLYGGDSNE